MPLCIAQAWRQIIMSHHSTTIRTTLSKWIKHRSLSMNKICTHCAYMGTSLKRWERTLMETSLYTTRCNCKVHIIPVTSKACKCPFADGLLKLTKTDGLIHEQLSSLVTDLTQNEHSTAFLLPLSGDRSHQTDTIQSLVYRKYPLWWMPCITFKCQKLHIIPLGITLGIKCRMWQKAWTCGLFTI